MQVSFRNFLLGYFYTFYALFVTIALGLKVFCFYVLLERVNAPCAPVLVMIIGRLVD
jgi:hypothetical protein